MRLPFVPRRSGDPNGLVEKQSAKGLAEDVEKDDDEKVDDKMTDEKNGGFDRGDELLKEKKGDESGVKGGRMDELRARQLDTGDIKYIFRKKWWQIW